jgi:hypothetical protein
MLVNPAADTPSGNVPLVIRVEGHSIPATATIAVQ